MWLFIAFLLVPLIEIALFIEVGSLIGLWATLLIVVLTAIAGTYLVRSQGLAELSRVQSSFNSMRDPTRPLAHGAMILFSGALLLTPGFFTDAVGFALLVPAVRDKVMQAVAARITVRQAGFQPRAPQRDDVIDGEFEVHDTDAPPRTGGPRPPSGWTRD
jgi:UPF0716 protein FxsA